MSRIASTNFRSWVFNILTSFSAILIASSTEIELVLTTSPGFVPFQDFLMANTINPVHHWAFRPGVARSARVSDLLSRLAKEYNLDLLDVHGSVSLRRQRFWAQDMVHFGERGHIHVANRAAKLIGVPHRLTVPSFDEPPRDYQTPRDLALWIYRHVLPFSYRVFRRITAGDGIAPKHENYVTVRADAWPTRLVSNAAPSRVQFSAGARV
jgi:hypothetical protein